MPLTLRPSRHYDAPGTTNARNARLQHAEFRRIDGIVGEVDGKKSRLNLFEIRGRVIVHGGFDLIEPVVGVGLLRPLNELMI